MRLVYVTGPTLSDLVHHEEGGHAVSTSMLGREQHAEIEVATWLSICHCCRL